MSGTKRAALLAAMTFGSILAMAAASELVVRAYFSARQSYIVEMWRYGRHHKRSVADGRSHEHRPGTRSTVMGKSVRIDRWGYRGPDREPAASGRRILALGDSITFGFGVAEAEAFAALLEKKLPETQVWNAGVGNYNTEQEMTALPDHLRRLHPTEVVLGFFINDLEPVQRGPKSSLLEGSLLFALASQIWWSYADDSRRDYAAYYQHWFDVGWSSWSAAAERGIELLRREKIPLKVLLIPEFHALKTGRFSADYKKVETFFMSKGVPVCDAEAYFPDTKTGGTEYWAAPDDSHPNAQGHSVLARALVSCFYQGK
ncbi:MAG: SGNH/GDSL hydrolase family protein [Proteobacteria bacterium]|nr:SGNH/GDSL hydrolase family protein [Pseudomonadota bacterium]